ncbi:MAG: hypothetical protein IJ849_12435 [Selenomonadaceae bacterium]|nr:hypothetical protein [Selenomonadaceae bacterium]
MNEQRYPLLEDLHVLRTAALTSIRDRAFDALPLYYAEYSDGIVSGCGISINRDSLTVEPGIVRHGGFMYFLRQPMPLTYAPTEEYMILKLRFGMPQETESFLERSLRLVLSPDMDVHPDEMELARFKLKSGAILRTKYTDFFDRVTEFNTVNVIHSPYAAIGRSTLHPEVVAAFAKEAAAYQLEPLDEAFCLAALQNLPVAYEQVAFYLRRRLKQDTAEFDNEGLYQGLCQVLREVQTGGRIAMGRAHRARREVYVD